MLRAALLTFLTFLTLVDAKDFEFTPTMGLNSLENSGKVKLEHPNMGISMQYNQYKLKPRFDLEYTSIQNSNEKVESLLRPSINAVYEFDLQNSWHPYLVAGVGYEKVSQARSGFSSNPFVQGGGGVRYNFNETIGMKVETRALQSISEDSSQQNEILATLGLSFAIGEHEREAVFDEDEDGVMNSLDKCDDTPEDVEVDSDGCPKKEENQEHVVFQKPYSQTYVDTPLRIQPVPMVQERSIVQKRPEAVQKESSNEVETLPNELTQAQNVTQNTKTSETKPLNVHFGDNSSYLTDYSRPKVEEFATFLKENPQAKVLITGHTDSVGDEGENEALSLRRAESIKHALVEDYGIEDERIDTLGAGESKPLYPNNTKRHQQLNRRIEVTINY